MKVLLKIILSNHMKGETHRKEKKKAKKDKKK